MHHWGRKLEELKKRVSSGLISSRKRKWSVLRAVNNKIEIRRDTLLYLSPYFAFFDNVILHLQCEIFWSFRVRDLEFDSGLEFHFFFIRALNRVTKGPSFDEKRWDPHVSSLTTQMLY